MTDRYWQRIGASCGILYVVLEITGLGFGMANSFASVDLDSSKGEIALAFANPASTGAWIGIYLEVLSVLFFIVFAARLWATLRRAEGDPGWLSLAAFGSALTFAAMTLVAFSLAGTATYWAGHGLDAQISLALGQVGFASYVLTWAVGALFLGAAAVVVLRTGALSRWLGWSAAGIAVASLAAVAVPISGPAQLPAFLFLFWIVAVSIVLMRREEEQAPVLTGALSPSA
jgi:hypothetical protein